MFELRVSRYLLSDILLYIFPLKNFSNMSSRFPILYFTKDINYKELSTGVKSRCNSLHRKAKAVVTKLTPVAFSLKQTPKDPTSDLENPQVSSWPVQFSGLASCKFLTLLLNPKSLFWSTPFFATRQISALIQNHGQLRSIHAYQPTSRFLSTIQVLSDWRPKCCTRWTIFLTNLNDLTSKELMNGTTLQSIVLLTFRNPT